MIFTLRGLVDIKYISSEDEAVKIAAANLKSDLYKVLESRVRLHCVDNEFDTVTFGVQNGPAVLADSTVYPQNYQISKIMISSRDNCDRLMKDAKGLTEQIPDKKEGYLIAVEDNILYLLGNDRRGTIYAIYEFSEMLGVSPWYFFADVPAKKKETFELEEGYRKSDYPSVEYRGIFINDEEELEKWVINYMSETTIGPKTYAYIFELLLRLKCNYVWPAMHVNSFNANMENGRLAEKMGIVVGTSHCDMLMRSNNREWEPWKKRKGYENLEYDFSIKGENREKLLEYWRESVVQNKDFQVTYTLGMRGIHDSGFHTKAFAGLTGKALLNAKIKLLSDVLDAQNRILEEIPHKSAGKIFVPYKEVLELYDNGLEVPDDITLIWTNDNYGHVRRYPDEMARNRSGGNGLYYHNSYWAPPGASYLFICSIPFAQTRNELVKAYHNGIKKLWVTNFGAIKPLEQHLSFYADLAWNIGKENDITADVDSYLASWLDKTFSDKCGRELAPLLHTFDQVTNLRKIELMEDDVFYQSADCDEAAGRIHFLKNVFEKVNEVYDRLPVCERDAFFQIVMFRVHAAYYTNCMYYYADRSALMASLAKEKEADHFFDLSGEYDRARQALITYYNHIMANGKWNGIVTPEDYPPPRTAMYPAAVPGGEIAKRFGINKKYVCRKMTEDHIENRITIEAVRGIGNQDIKVIPRLGRGIGSLVEFENGNGILTFTFTVENEADYNLTLERFPSLDSVAEIGIDVSIDGKETVRLVSLSKDEHLGSWKTNILNDVELLTLALGKITVGEHRLVLKNASRYFALTRLHIYTGMIRRNHIWHEAGMNPFLDLTTTPANVELPEIIDKYYAGATANPRQELCMPVGFGNNVIINEDIYGYSPECMDGSISIDVCGEDSIVSGESPDFCVGVGRDKISFYYRDPIMFEQMTNMAFPKLKYRFHVLSEGRYVVWVCVYAKGNEEYRFDMSIDNEDILKEKESKRLWKYSSENVYKWIPVAVSALTEGTHMGSFTFKSAKLRLEGICFTKEG